MRLGQNQKWTKWLYCISCHVFTLHSAQDFSVAVISHKTRLLVEVEIAAKSLIKSSPTDTQLNFLASKQFQLSNQFILHSNLQKGSFIQ